MRVILTAVDGDLHDAWRNHCGHFDFVSIVQGSILETPATAVVSPANSFGFMDGGIDAAYTRHFGEHVETRVQRTIKDDYDGELLVGQAIVVTTGNKAIPYLIAAPTMRVPMRLPADTVNPYLAAKAAILCAKRLNEMLKVYTGDPKAVPITSVAFPGMGTGVGGLDPERCAAQVAQAIQDTLVMQPM